MIKTTFKIDKMDCPCEENLIRLKLQDFRNIKRLDFDLASRTLSVFHIENEHEIAQCIDSLNLSSHLMGSIEVQDVDNNFAESDRKQRKSLWIVLGINFAFFVIEILTGFLSRSMGLVADSLDMLADAFVYGLSLLVVGAVVAKKKRVAKFSGYLQLLLAILGFVEVIKRTIGMEEIPQFQTMIIVSILALLANAASLYILQKTKNKEAHIQASVICSSNDVIINAGVILAGIGVWLLNSKIPDLAIGTIVFILVIRGAIRILKLSK